MKKSILLILLLCTKLVFANTSGTDSLVSNLTLSSYFETYYTYDFGKAQPEKVLSLVNHHKNNEIAINIALIKANYSTERYRANLGVMVGSYANKNYVDLESNFKNIYESNVGVKLSKKNNLWFDVGIFTSHIGAEGVIGKDNWTLTRSLQAEASPYYEAGARLSYTNKNGKLYASIMALNGWQVINKKYNYPLSFGHQITYKINDRFLLNSSSYIGNNNSNSIYNRNRFFHNLYSTQKWNEKFSTLFGFDIGSEEMWNKTGYYSIWYSPIFIARYAITNKHALAFRAEYFKDDAAIVFKTNTMNEFACSGFSLNYDWRINDDAMFRIEGKIFTNEEPVFLDNNALSNTNQSITTAFILNLNH
jgi:hypothetical protein